MATIGAHNPLEAQLLVQVHAILGRPFLHKREIKEVSVVGHKHRRLGLAQERHMEGGRGHELPVTQLEHDRRGETTTS